MQEMEYKHHYKAIGGRPPKPVVTYSLQLRAARVEDIKAEITQELDSLMDVTPESYDIHLKAFVALQALRDIHKKSVYWNGVFNQFPRILEAIIEPVKP